MIMENKLITLNVNGKTYQLPRIPGETLSDLLRLRLKLTGTKIACEESECGACTVIMNGESVLSCSTPSEKANGKFITTIEGLAKEENGKTVLHPLQETFINNGAVQCGFCIPGQIMTAYGLLQREANPTSADIHHALKDTLCRCAGYPTIERSILEAAESLRNNRAVEKMANTSNDGTHKVVGTAQARPDSVEKVTGMAIYSDDLVFDDMVFGAVRRALVPHAFVRSINIEKAKALPGVLSVLTADDIPGEKFHGLVIYDWPVMVGINERVRYVGDAIAIVAAETTEIARAAADLVEVEFDLQPVISDPVISRHPESDSLHPNGNLLKHIKVRKGDVQQGFDSADIVMEEIFHTPSTDHLFMEPECSVAVPTKEGRMEIYVGSQIPYQDRLQVSRTLGVAEDRVRIVGQLMGGGFGGKEDIAGQIHAAMLAQKLNRPVKILWDRHESLIVHPKRHATQIKVKIGAMKDGTLVSAQTELYGDTGAYASLGEKVLTRATTHSAGPYIIPNVHADCYAMYTNNPPAGAFRGFGVLQSAFAIESVMDMLAEKLNIDRIELRRKNALRVGAETSTGQVLRDSAGLVDCIDKVQAEMIRVSGLRQEDLFKPRKVQGAEHLVRAWGFASAFKNTGLGGGADDCSGAHVELYPTGKFQVRSAAAELGQGLVTVMQLVVCEELSQNPENVKVLVMDTDLTPNGGPTTASRQTFVTGNASKFAAIEMRNLITGTIAEKYDVDPDLIKFSPDGLLVSGKNIPFSQVYLDMVEMNVKPLAEYEYHAPVTTPLGVKGDMHVAFSFASQAAEIEVNQNTGEVKVIQVISANDVGKVINPVGLQGQVEGGVVMGVGHALLENFITEDGYVITDRMSRYRIPSIMHTPLITSIVVEDPSADGPYGAKGVGEIVLIPTPPAITNALYNITGLRLHNLPVDQEMVLKHLAEKK
jgi:xanthine dehydrogenase molybdenum-binding subunit